jgi:hypothetical protein
MEESHRLLAQQQPVVLMNFSHMDKTWLQDLMLGVNKGVTRVLPCLMEHIEIYMMSLDAYLQTRAHNYDKT